MGHWSIKNRYNMGKYILKRSGLLLITFSIITIVYFVTIRLMPIDREAPFGVDPTYWANVIIREGWDRPIIEQFWFWLRNIITRGDFGFSRSQTRNSMLVLRDRIPITVRLNLIPFFIAVPAGFALGVVAALKKNKWQDHVISFVVMLFISVPSFVVAVLGQYFLVYRWRILPHAFVLPSAEAAIDPWGNILSRILPTFVLASGTIAALTRNLRAELTEILTSDFMVLAKAKGLTSRQATVRHALRNAFVPFAPAITGGFIGLLGGSFVIEQAFRVPGIGRMYLTAFNTRDLNLIMLLMMFYTFLGLVAQILGDISYGIVDPRIKMGAGLQ